MHRRIVVKVGTSVLTGQTGRLELAVIKHIADQIVAIKKKGSEVILITSGAMGAGRGLIAVTRGEKAPQKQVLAAVGQVKLMSTYADLFAKHGQVCAQVLATKEDFRDKIHYLNMRTCFENLLASGVIPIVNENDVVATTELLFTDNDELAGLVASQLSADIVIILMSVDGFLAGDPEHAIARVVHEIDFKDIGSYQKYIVPNGTDFGRGGMLTKFNVAKKLALQGIPVHFANGRRANVLGDILDGNCLGTAFLPRRRASNVKRRIAYSEDLTKGIVHVNQCAEELLLSKKKIMSLLPVGVVKVEGSFDKGDIIEIMGTTRHKLGFGIAEYDAKQARELIGMKRARPVIHYNHMFIGE